MRALSFGLIVLAGCAADATPSSTTAFAHLDELEPTAHAPSHECITLRDGRDGARATTTIVRVDLTTGALTEGPRLSEPLGGVALGRRGQSLFACGARIDIASGLVVRLRDDCAELTTGDGGVWLGVAAPRGLAQTRLYPAGDLRGAWLRDVSSPGTLLGADGARLLVAGSDVAGGATLLDARTGTALRSIDVPVAEGEHWSLQGADLTADGRFVVLRPVSLATHAVVAEPTGERVKTLILPSQAHGLVCDGAYSQ